jgi:hypothetical protein
MERPDCDDQDTTETCIIASLETRLYVSPHLKPDIKQPPAPSAFYRKTNGEKP